MTTTKFPRFGYAAPTVVEEVADPFQDAADVVRAKIQLLNGLFHTGSEEIIVQVDNASLQASISLEAMRDLASAMPPNHKRDMAFEFISELSSRLSRRLEKLSQDLSQIHIHESFARLSAVYARYNNLPVPTHYCATVH